MNVDLLTTFPGVVEKRGWVLRANICYQVATFRDSNKFDMQHDHVLEKLNFDLNPRVNGWGWVGVCEQKICYHTAAFVITFN